MDEREARVALESRAAAGATLVVGGESDWAGIKRLQQRCLDAGIPAILGECPGRR